jgi:hypothetical protein
MSLAPAPKMALDKTSCNIGKAEEPCIVTEDDNLKTDCYESMHAFKKIRTSTSGLRKSPNKWTKEENQKLAALVAHYGEKKWKRISAEMGGQKTGAQCAQHWKRVLSPEIRKGHWDENEEDLLLRLVVQYGSCWKKIAKKIPQRTDIQCRYQYLKAKQSREVKWDIKEDESLIKKVMEMANCNYFKFVNDPPCNTNSSFNDSSNSNHTNPLSNTTITSSSRSPSRTNKVNETESLLSSSGNSDISDDHSSMKSSGESSGECMWNDSKSDVHMSDSGEVPIPIPSIDHENASSSYGLAINKIVWLEIAEHMARLKLTSTLRTALECKTRFMELLGKNFPPFPNNLSPNDGQDVNRKLFELKESGGIENRNALRSSMNDTSINININTRSDNNNNNITITNFSHNITISIHNSTNNTNNANFPHNHSNPYKTATNPGVKSESTSPTAETSAAPTTTTTTGIPPAPSFPSFPHFSQIAHPIAPTAKPARNAPNGLESLAAVASILPREMLADYVQF